MLRAVPGLGGPLTAEFEVGFVGTDGTEARASLIDSTEVRFDLVRPVRGFPSHKRQRNFPGLWWSSTTGGHVGYESWLERDHLMLLDFDPAVVGVASQPFWLFWDDEAGRRRSHAPDYFARLVDGRGLVVDCRPAERIKPRDAAAFAATRRACELVRLRPRGGAAQVVLLAFLLAATDFELLNEQAAVPAVEPFGLLETLPDEVVDRARRWERHVVEVDHDMPIGYQPDPDNDEGVALPELISALTGSAN